MAIEYVYEYGKRWDRRVPRGSLTFVVDRLHVATPDAEIEADIRKRCASNAEFTPALIRQSVAYALIVHARNRGLYRRVMRG